MAECLAQCKNKGFRLHLVCRFGFRITCTIADTAVIDRFSPFLIEAVFEVIAVFNRCNGLAAALRIGYGAYDCAAERLSARRRFGADDFPGVVAVDNRRRRLIFDADNAARAFEAANLTHVVAVGDTAVGHAGDAADAAVGFGAADDRAEVCTAAHRPVRVTDDTAQIGDVVTAVCICRMGSGDFTEVRAVFDPPGVVENADDAACAHPCAVHFHFVDAVLKCAV